MITIDFKHLDLKRGDRILDIGCGEGRHTAKAWESPGVLCVGADRCHGDLLISKKKLKLHQELSEQTTGATNKEAVDNSIWTLLCADITRLPFGNHSFDAVICSEVMEHIHNEDKAISELKRVLKPAGRLALSVPRYWPEKICWKLSHEYSNSQGGHIRIYTKKGLLKKIIPSGFEFQGSHHAHSLHAPFWWLKCLTGLGHNNSDSKLVSLYHKLLVWDLMEKPFITQFIEKLLNPVMGKSLVLYFRSDSSINL
ncbi:MAG: methyltransferase domain-containing protein [Desulfamplus sp.]|nr:methyltransferase domain-containing protein [Desulfamplus sp.]MBF0258173.1 methyltransferase domain-containing protein [Desulfamplus sp.]